MKDIVQEISTPFEFNHNFIRDWTVSLEHYVLQSMSKIELLLWLYLEMELREIGREKETERKEDGKER